MTAKSLALIWGLIFIAVGLLGFIDNPIVYDSPDAIFHANTLHNIVHIASGALFVLVALASPGSAAGFLKFFGVVYLAIGVIGFFSVGGADGMGKVLGILHVNKADNFLHVALGLAIFISGAASRRSPAIA